MDAAVAALLGAGIGAGFGVIGSLGASWIQQRHTTRRYRLKLATELAIEDRNEMREKLLRTQGGGPLPPLALFVAYHIDMLNAVDAGTFNEERIREIEERQKRLLLAMPIRDK